MKKYLLLGFVLPALLSAGIALAHGGADDHAGVLHPGTQIGLPGSEMSHGGMAASSSGMTREEVAALIHDTQATEETRSAVKLTTLTIFILGLVYLYFPRRRVTPFAASPERNVSPVPPNPPLTPTTSPTHDPGRLS